MPATLTFDDLKSRVADGSVDTVLACLVDMQGRLMGKRFHAVNFVETSFDDDSDVQEAITILKDKGRYVSILSGK